VKNNVAKKNTTKKPATKPVKAETSNTVDKPKKTSTAAIPTRW